MDAALYIACGIAAVVVWARLVWLIALKPWIERLSDYLRVRREFPRWFQ